MLKFCCCMATVFVDLTGSGSVDLFITVDNDILEVYFDGKQVTVTAAEWNVVRKVSMPTRTRTIAVKSQDRGVSCLSVGTCVQRKTIFGQRAAYTEKLKLA